MTMVPRCQSRCPIDGAQCELEAGHGDTGGALGSHRYGSSVAEVVPPNTRGAIFAAIRAERKRQGEKWNRFHSWGYGDCSNPELPNPVKVAVLTEEVGEVAKAMLERDNEALRTELVQVAAVCVAWLESLERTM